MNLEELKERNQRLAKSGNGFILFTRDSLPPTGIPAHLKDTTMVTHEGPGNQGDDNAEEK